MDRMIKELPNDYKIPFRSGEVDREIRAMKSKMNEIIRAINQLNEPVYADDFDDDELIEMLKGETENPVFSPQEARSILSDRVKKKKGDKK